VFCTHPTCRIFNVVRSGFIIRQVIGPLLPIYRLGNPAFWRSRTSQVKWGGAQAYWGKTAVYSRFKCLKFMENQTFWHVEINDVEINVFPDGVFCKKERSLQDCHSEVRTTRSLSGCSASAPNITWLSCSPYVTVVLTNMSINVKQSFICGMYSS
jgi:hypothetical protein